MREIGFWDYVCPGHGSLERYSKSDWDILLDDVAEGGFNAFALCPKWLTTGYKSRYNWLDQDPTIAAVQTDNASIHHALEGMRKRGLKTWLLAVGSIFTIDKFGFPPAEWTPTAEGKMPKRSPYDLDQPSVGERIEMLYGEIAELFGSKTDGICIELEFCDGEAPHRIPLYNQWAKENGRPPYEKIKDIKLQPRAYPFWDWRDFTTSRRILMYQRIEKSMRAAGFRGQISTMAEMDNGPTAVCGNVNLKMLKAAHPDSPLVTYDSIYDRRLNRLATMDFCIEQPRALGMEIHWLTRGIMTFNWPPDAPPMDLREQWRMELEDALRFKPETLWFMGTDARHEGMVCDPNKLPAWGFEDGRIARRHLMKMAAEMGLTKPR